MCCYKAYHKKITTENEAEREPLWAIPAFYKKQLTPQLQNGGVKSFCVAHTLKGVNLADSCLDILFSDILKILFDKLVSLLNTVHGA